MIPTYALYSSYAGVLGEQLFSGKFYTAAMRKKATNGRASGTAWALCGRWQPPGGSSGPMQSFDNLLNASWRSLIARQS
jgi:hypothetical protein